MHHELKITVNFYIEIIEWRKTCELRYNDRDYKIWDTISFTVLFDDAKSVEPEKYIITHVLQYPEWLKDWWVVLSLKKI